MVPSPPGLNARPWRNDVRGVGRGVLARSALGNGLALGMLTSDELLAQLNHAHREFLRLTNQKQEITKRWSTSLSTSESAALDAQLFEIQIKLDKTLSECDRLTTFHVDSLDLPET